MAAKSEQIKLYDQPEQPVVKRERAPLVKQKKLTRQGERDLEAAEKPDIEKLKIIAEHQARERARLELNAYADKWGYLISNELSDGTLAPQDLYDLFKKWNYKCVDTKEAEGDEIENLANNVEDAIKTKEIHWQRFQVLYNCAWVIEDITKRIKSGKTSLGKVLSLIGINIGITHETPLEVAIKRLREVLIEDKILHVEQVMSFVSYHNMKVDIDGKNGEKYVYGKGSYGQIEEIWQDLKLDFEKVHLPFVFVNDEVVLEDGSKGIVESINNPLEIRLRRNGIRKRIGNCIKIKLEDGNIKKVSPKDIKSRKFQECDT